jgi:hypothetical protein
LPRYTHVRLSRVCDPPSVPSYDLALR